MCKSITLRLWLASLARSPGAGLNNASKEIVLRGCPVSTVFSCNNLIAGAGSHCSNRIEIHFAENFQYIIRQFLLIRKCKLAPAHAHVGKNDAENWIVGEVGDVKPGSLPLILVIVKFVPGNSPENVRPQRCKFTTPFFLISPPSHSSPPTGQTRQHDPPQIPARSPLDEPVPEPEPPSSTVGNLEVVNRLNAPSDLLGDFDRAVAPRVVAIDGYSVARVEVSSARNERVDVGEGEVAHYCEGEEGCVVGGGEGGVDVERRRLGEEEFQCLDVAVAVAVAVVGAVKVKQSNNKWLTTLTLPIPTPTPHGNRRSGTMLQPKLKNLQPTTPPHLDAQGKETLAIFGEERAGVEFNEVCDESRWRHFILSLSRLLARQRQRQRQVEGKLASGGAGHGGEAWKFVEELPQSVDHSFRVP